MAVFLAAALRRVDRLVHGGDDLGNRDGLRRARQVVAAAGTADARHQLVAAELAEELLQVGKRNTLALADGCERHGTAGLAHRQVDHCGNGKPALRSESHMPSGERNKRAQYLIKMVKYTPKPTVSVKF